MKDIRILNKKQACSIAVDFMYAAQFRLDNISRFSNQPLSAQTGSVRKTTTALHPVNSAGSTKLLNEESLVFTDLPWCNQDASCYYCGTCYLHVRGHPTRELRLQAFYVTMYCMHRHETSTKSTESTGLKKHYSVNNTGLTSSRRETFIDTMCVNTMKRAFSTSVQDDHHEE